MVRIVDLIPDIEQAHYPQLDGGLCVHGMLADASCRACIDSCPRDAWDLTDEALEIATGACDGCGLCIPACPQAALSLPIKPLVRYHDSEQVALMACDRVIDRDQAGSVPCIYCYGSRVLLEFHVRGIRKWVVATGECSACSRAGDLSAAGLPVLLSSALQQRGHDAILMRKLPVGKWVAYRDSLSETDPSAVSRRDFFRGIAKAASDHLERNALEPAQQALLAGQGLMPRHCAIDTERCDLCEACHKVCPTQAICLDKGETVRLVVDSSRCNGCMLCMDVCDDAAAISVQPWEEAAIQEIPCNERRCSACGVGYLSIPGDSGTTCGICRRIDHRRNLYQTIT
jgi:NAD-dependent dihydropyrimidine dehydrogenase PreA subunit